MFIGLVSSVTSGVVMYDSLSSQLFVLTGLSEPVEFHGCGLQFFLHACVFVFKPVGCHLKSTGAVQSALNPAGRRGKRTRVRGGPDEEKHHHFRHQTGKRKGGAGTLGFCLFVFELIGCLRKKKKRKEDNPDVAKHNLTPVSFSFFSLFGYSPSDALFSLALFFAWLLSAALG